ncbi:UNVERIFIED_CONTAM: hypothetical protein FKN15_007644 [Acipenser sinensis]
MPLRSTKLILEETRSLKIDKKKPISSNLSKGITTILDNTSEVRSIDTPDLPHVKKGVLKNTSVTDHKILISGLMVGSEDWDPVEVDLLLEELRDIPVTPEKKGKSNKVSGGGEDPGKVGNTQLKKNTSTTSYIKYLEPTRHNTDTSNWTLQSSELGCEAKGFLQSSNEEVWLCLQHIHTAQHAET